VRAIAVHPLTDDHPGRVTNVTERLGEHRLDEE
jgi:hypothetical protein